MTIIFVLFCNNFLSKEYSKRGYSFGHIKIPLTLVGGVLLFSDLLFGSNGWTDIRQITNTSGIISNNSNACSNNRNIYSVFTDNSGTSISGIFFKRSIDNGRTWSTPLFLSTLNINAVHPSVSSKDSYVYICWEDNRSEDIYQIFFKRSLDNGVTWESSDIQISGFTSNSSKPSLTVDNNNNIHLTWINNSIVRYKKGFNNGVNWSDYMSISAGNSNNPKILSGLNGSVYVLWNEGTPSVIKFSKSSDDGQTWAPPVSISSGNAAEIAASIDKNGNVYVVWEQDNKIYFRKYYNNSWFLEKTVSTNLSGSAKYPSLTLDSNNNVHICWSDNRDGTYKIYYTKSADGGISFGSEESLTTVLTPGHLELITFELNLHLFWLNGNQLYYRMKDAIQPALPSITSVTHKENVKNENNCPVFSWQSEDNIGGIGIYGFSFVFDKEYKTIPDSTVNYYKNLISFPNTPNGTWYFHLRSVDWLNNWSETSNFKVLIDNSRLLPESEVWCQPSPVRNGKATIRYFLEADSHVTVKFYNEAGSEISSFEKEGTTGVNVIDNLDMSAWANGVYFYKIKAKNTINGAVEEIVKKIAVMR